MKKYILAIAVLAIVPSVAFASWWNPTTWGIFSFLFSSTPQVQIASTTTVLNRTIEQPAVSIEATSTIPPPVRVQTQQQTQPASDDSCGSGSFFDKTANKCMTPLTYCKGQRGSKATYNPEDNSCGCAVGYTLNSNGMCTIQKTGYQVCAEMNATWDGSSYMSNGAFNCSCQAGYIPSSDRTSCQDNSAAIARQKQIQAQISALQQQITNIKNQYSNQGAARSTLPNPFGYQTSVSQNQIDQANYKISQISQQIQNLQLQMEYSSY